MTVATDLLAVAAWLCVMAGAAVTAYNLALVLQENAYLTRAVAEIVPGGRVRTRADLVQLKRHITARISYEGLRRDMPRPLLRDSALTTLVSGRGFCGEAARVTILLLERGGVRAHRIYLEGAQWGHVVVEHAWEGHWVLIDGFSDPGTLLADDLVTKVGSDDLPRFPNAHAANPWLASYRLKLFHLVPFLRRFQRLRAPRLVVAIAERPAAIRALAGLVFATAGLLAFLVVRP